MFTESVVICFYSGNNVSSVMYEAMIPQWLEHLNINRDTLGSNFLAAVSKLRQLISSSVPSAG